MFGRNLLAAYVRSHRVPAVAAAEVPPGLVMSGFWLWPSSRHYWACKSVGQIV
jgi:hypothetical protein